MSPISDGRVRAFAALMLPCFIGHAIQLLDEDKPWTELAARRYWITPGWHLHLPPAVPIALAGLLVLAVVAVAVRRDRASMLALFAAYAAHYFTYPFRIRNHMTTMLFGLGVLALVWGVARASGALREPDPRARTVDRMAARGLAAVITVQYLFAGLHKLNPVFTDASVDSPSVAIQGLTTFWIYGDLGSVPPAWARGLAAWGSIAIELTAAPIAWLAPRFAFGAVLVLLAFNVPIVSALDIADYPMIASAFFPALLTRAQWRLLAPQLRPSRWTALGAVAGGATQLWFMPWWGPMSAYGICVLALWGWAVGALARLTYLGVRRRAAGG